VVRSGWPLLNLGFVVASFVVVFIATFGRPSRLSKWVNSWRPITDDSPYALWKGLISGIILAALLVLCLIGVNSMKGAVGKFPVNIAILILLVGDLLGMWSVVRRFKRSRSKDSSDD
jgi:glycerol uptake facilitator-like aquaporin